jgi:hypothetical protein
MNQLLQKEFVDTLYFSTGTSSCAIPDIEILASASPNKNFFIMFNFIKQSIIISKFVAKVWKII